MLTRFNGWFWAVARVVFGLRYRIHVEGAAFELISRRPDGNVVLVRTRDVWGSSFSCAASGALPKLSRTVVKLRHVDPATDVDRSPIVGQAVLTTSRQTRGGLAAFDRSLGFKAFRNSNELSAPRQQSLVQCIES